METFEQNLPLAKDKIWSMQGDDMKDAA